MAAMGKDYWVRWNLEILHSVRIIENAEFLAEKIDEQWFDYAGLETFPDVLPTVSKLKKTGVKTGIVTNGLERDYNRILNELKLTDFFDVVVGGDACRKAKPNQAIFLYALDKLQVKPEEAVFVGDSLDCDYEGAKNVGMKSLLIVRNSAAPSGVDAIGSLTQVLEFLS
jgi:2-haloalkanoic acid dehalogenase type II